MRQRSEATLLEEVGSRLGFRDPEQSVRVSLAVLQPLLGCLSSRDGADLEVALSRRLRHGLRHDHPIAGIAFQPPDRFLVELAERNQIHTATAATWTRVVCAALVRELPFGVIDTIAAQVPALVRAFFPEGERLAPRLPERAHRYDGVPPLWSAIERPVPSYLMFESGVPLPEETHVPHARSGGARVGVSPG